MGVTTDDWINRAAEEIRVALLRPFDAEPGRGRSEEQAAQAFADAIQPVWDAFTGSIRDTAARFNRSVGRELIGLPTDLADIIQLRAALGSWNQTIDIRLDRNARCIVGRRSEDAPSLAQPPAGVPMPTLTLQVTATPMHFDHHHMTANEAGSVVVKRLVGELRRHCPDARG